MREIFSRGDGEEVFARLARVAGFSDEEISGSAFLEHVTYREGSVSDCWTLLTLDRIHVVGRRCR